MKRSIKRLFRANKIRLSIYFLVIVLFSISLILFSLSILKLNGIETLLRILVLILLISYFVFYTYKGCKYIINRNKIKYGLLIGISVFISILLLIITYYVNILYGGISNITKNNNSLYTGYMISLKDTENGSIKKIGLIKDNFDIEGYKIAKKIIEEQKIKSEIVHYDTYEDMLYDLYHNIIDASFVQSNYISYFESIEGYADVKNKTKIVYKKTEKMKIDSTSNNKALKEPFTILLMGVDSTEDTIDTNKAFNGDTLMLLTFNPKTLNATMFSIPRDLYVPITCKNNTLAKINSSSVGGVNCVKNTIKSLMDINIDYYLQINFKGVVDLVDALNGINVNVTYEFCEQDSNRDFTNQICLKKGYQLLDGEEALAFARHRHSLPTGDLTRIQNQQLIVEALANKVMSLNTLTDFKDIMDAISHNVYTNMSTDEILSSYNILKDMVINAIADKESLVVEKAYLEVYDMNVYNEKYNTYSAALGYYEDSLKDISKAMKVNLELEKAEMIKEFSFDANTPYELKVLGKGIKNNVSLNKVIDFTNKTVNEAKAWGKNNDIDIVVEYVNINDSKYNNNCLPGVIGNQSVRSGTLTKGIKKIIVYVNTNEE